MAKGDEIIQRYYEASGSTMDFDDFREICTTPFKHMRRGMSLSTLPEIRIMYMGTFVVNPGQILGMLKFTESRYKKNLIDEKQYMRYIKLLTDYIKAHAADFKKHEDKLEKWKTYLS